MSDPRKHHFLPVCYLKGFTVENSRDGRLHVFNLQSNERFELTPQNAGCQRDLYKLDVPEGDDAFFVERAISGTLEGPFSRIRDSIVSRKALPCTPRDWNALLNFIAFQAVRVPAAIDAVKWISSQFARGMLRETSRDPSKFEQIEKSLSEAGNPLEGTLEDLREAVRKLDSGDMTMTLNRTHLIDLMMKMMNDFLHMIPGRPWRLLIADDKAPDLICSDRPVIISTPPTNPGGGRFETWLRGAQLTFPLTRRMWLISNLRFDSECVQECATKTVAAANRRIALHADRFLFSPNPVFTYAVGKKLRESSNFADFLKYRERRGASALRRHARP